MGHRYKELRSEIEAFMEWGSDDRSYVTTTSATLFAEHKLDQQAEELARLRAVYEAARGVLRYDGCDEKRLRKAMTELDATIESVKRLDEGNDTAAVQTMKGEG